MLGAMCSAWLVGGSACVAFVAKQLVTWPPLRPRWALPEERAHQYREENEPADASSDSHGDRTARTDDLPLPSRQAPQHSGMANTCPSIHDNSRRHKRNTRRRRIRASEGRATVRSSKLSEKQAEPRDDEAESHERDSRADPREKRSLGGKSDARVKIIGRVRRHITSVMEVSLTSSQRPMRHAYPHVEMAPPRTDSWTFYERQGYALPTNPAAAVE